MLAEIKRDFRLLKYVPQFKANVIMSIVIFVIGIPMLFLPNTASRISVMYLLLGATLLQSNFYTLLRVDMISASHRKKYIDGLIANMILIVGTVIAYTLVSVRMATMRVSEADADPRKAMISAILIMVIEIIYCGIAYKCWWLGSGVFFVVTMMLLMTPPQELIGTLPDIGMGAIIAIGAVAVMLANVISCVLRKVLYRRAMTFQKNINTQKKL